MSRAKIERAQCIVLARKHRALSIFIGRSPRVTIREANCDMRAADCREVRGEARDRNEAKPASHLQVSSAILVTAT